jgi:hypothetical protein
MCSIVFDAIVLVSVSCLAFRTAFRLYEAELKTLLGVDNITVKCLEDALRQHNLPLSKQLVRYHRILCETLTAASLACDYIPGDHELDDYLDCD